MRSRKPSRGLSGSSFRWTDLLVRPSPESLARGKELLEHAIQLDPQFALPYSILGVHYTMQATLRPAREVIPLARAAQQEALRVDPSLPEAHALLGVCAGMDYCWSEAEAHWGLAMTREPVSRDVLFWYGNHYLMPTWPGRGGRGPGGGPPSLLVFGIYPFPEPSTATCSS